MNFCRVKLNARHFCLLQVSQTYAEKQERYRHLNCWVLFRAFSLSVINSESIRQLPIKMCECQLVTCGNLLVRA